MTKALPVNPVPGPLEHYAERFDALSQMGQKDRSRGQAVAGQHRQDRQWGGERKHSMGGRRSVLASGLRALHSGASF